jgi:hypothetical protein
MRGAPPLSALLLVLLSLACAADAREANLARYAGETLTPGQGVGALTVGVTTLAEVLALFGETNAFEHGESTSVHHFANGLSITTEPARDPRGVIRTISAKRESIFGGKGWSGRTDEGVGLGDTREAVLAAYGEPSDFGSLKSLLHYESGITFNVRRGVVAEIVILRPRP